MNFIDKIRQNMLKNLQLWALVQMLTLFLFIVYSPSTLATLDLKTGVTKDPKSHITEYFLKPSEHKEDIFFKDKSDFLPGNIRKKIENPLGDDSQSVHWDIIFQLNILAKTIEKEIEVCYGDEIVNFRSDYFIGTLRCNLRGRILELHQQLYNFLLSTEVEPFKKQIKNNFSELAAWAKSSSLLTQALIEFLVTIIKFDQNEITPGVIVTNKLWVDYPYSLQFHNRVSILAIGKEVTLIKHEKYQLAKIYKNSRLLASILLDRETCETWGLWPETGYALSRFISWQKNRNWNNLKMFEFENPVCTPKSPQLLALSSPFWSAELITEYRSLAEKYGFKTSRNYTCYIDNWLKYWTRQSDQKWHRCFSDDLNNPEDIKSTNSGDELHLFSQED